MFNASAIVGINETMSSQRTTTGVAIGQHSQTLEAKAGPTMAAQHLVTFATLSALVLQVLFGDPHVAARALLSTSFSHPPAQSYFGFLDFSCSRPQGMLLACHAFMKWLCTTSQTTAFPALWALSQLAIFGII